MTEPMTAERLARLETVARYRVHLTLDDTLDLIEALQIARAALDRIDALFTWSESTAVVAVNTAHEAIDRLEGR